MSPTRLVALTLALLGAASACNAIFGMDEVVPLTAGHGGGGMGGAEAFPLLMAARPNLKVVVCSGYELDRAAQALLDAGASAFVQKPFRTRDLAPVVHAALDDSED